MLRTTNGMFELRAFVFYMPDTDYIEYIYSYFLNFGSWLPPEPSDDDVDFKSWGLFDI
jgi:hypothetical protein